MTVAELIYELQKYDGYLRVIKFTFEVDRTDVLARTHLETIDRVCESDENDDFGVKDNPERYVRLIF